MGRRSIRWGGGRRSNTSSGAAVVALLLHLFLLGNSLDHTEARIFSFFGCLFVGLRKGRCSWETMFTGGDGDCPVPNADVPVDQAIVCPADYSPVVCDYVCVYSNRCQAFAAGYDFDEYCWMQNIGK